MDGNANTEEDIVVSTYTSLHVSSNFLRGVAVYKTESERETLGASRVLQSISIDWKILLRAPGNRSRLGYICINTATLLRVLYLVKKSVLR